ncbi:lipopolysaccharide transport periplasmic protein LptA [Biformimicrobium ophioploci]|uniref:Lipopolysaccharide export system protein LptA n=1 Tax=Biformimicrobium ophioploci TaxID=3036711 RepID=A0ABQ6LX07_9GAMM|nr:lipopolysaccharide transport periplasmic protein LptA [Microbulbifer sp. NKW57]GMG86601.1 lipopolysaccharide transport periplasmic protein LptA [Microbulbifer sp. NKW57]
MRPAKAPLNKSLGLTASLLLALAAPALQALPGDRDQPIKVKSEHLEADRSKNLSVYSGNVEISQGSLKISADRVEVYGNEKGELSRVVAIGKPARFEQKVSASEGLVKAHARRIEFTIRSDMLNLSGEAFVDRDGNTLAAEKIEYDMSGEQMKAQGNQKGEQSGVEMIWQPEKPANQKNNNSKKKGQ